MLFRIYARYSSIGQSARSCDQQIDAARTWAARQPGPWRESAPPCRDEGISGYRHQREGRPGLDELISFVEAGSLDGGCILVWSTSRLSREFSYAITELLRLHRDHGVRLADVKHGVYDMSELGGRVTLTLAASMDEEYSKNISADVRRAKLDKAKMGYWASRSVPFGCGLESDGVGKVLVPGRRHADLIKLFTLAQSLSAVKVGHTLNREGILSPRGGQWGPNTVTKILSNPAYIGKVRHRGELYDGRHGPIIPVDLWQGVQYESTGQPGKKPMRFDWSKLIYCANCGAPCWRMAASRQGVHVYTYTVCRTRRRGVPCSDPGSVELGRLEDAVWGFLADYNQLDKSPTDAIIAAYNRSKLAEATAALAAAKERETRLVDALCAIADSAALVAKLEATVQERRQAEEAIKQIQAEGSAEAMREARAEKIALREGKTLREMVKRVEVGPIKSKHITLWLNGQKSNSPNKIPL